jgi:hypothetical protein
MEELTHAPPNTFIWGSTTTYLDISLKEVADHKIGHILFYMRFVSENSDL